MIGIPDRTEASPESFTYIDRINDGDILRVLESQRTETMALLRGVSEDRSLFRYAPGKWSIRELWNHVNDAERILTYRALWFARGYDAPLPGFDQDIAVGRAQADQIPWSRHVDEFGHIRLATLALFQNLPAEAWHKVGIANESRVTVRALAYVVAGHLAHHVTILRDQYR
jgi:hypothetical protein